MRAKEYLSQKGVRYREIDVSRDPMAAEELRRRTGQLGVPVITVDDQVVVGFDRARLDALLGKAAGKRPSLGLSIADASRMAVKVGAIPVFGAFVGRVAPSSPAERVGIRPGDIVVEANLRPVNNAADLERALEGLAPGSRLSLEVMRGEKRLRIEVSL